MDRMKEIIDKYGEDYMLCQLTEECCELGQAAMKVIRARNRWTPMRITEAMEKLVEEIADVHVMAGAIFKHMLDAEEQKCVDDTCEFKEARMYKRMLDNETEDDVW